MKEIKIELTEDKNHNPINIKLFGLLNEIDWAIIFYLGQKNRSVGELTKKLSIAPVNTWKHLKKLQELEIVDIPKVDQGKKKILELNKANKKMFYDFALVIYNLRTKIKDKG